MIIIRSRDAVTTKWSGGTTTQLAIWPAGALYADRDFIWRLSSAEVNDEKSTFTPLPDYKRFLTTRKGTLRMRHDGGDWYSLSEGDVSEFDGGSLTESEGKVTDFNLMLRKGSADGVLETEFLEDGETADLGPVEEGSFTAVYVSHGESLSVFCDGKEAAALGAGDLLVFEQADKAAELTATAGGEVYVIYAGIRVKG